MAYDVKAQDFAFSFYAKGFSKERALKEICKVYPGFSGATWDAWVIKLDWKTRRALLDVKARELDDFCSDAARAIILDLHDVQQKLLAKIKTAEEGAVDTQVIYAYNAVSKQIVDLARHHLASKDPLRVSMEALNSAIEKFLSELRELPGMGPVLQSNAGEIGRLVERIGEEFGRAA